MKKKVVAALMVGMALAMSGCSGGGKTSEQSSQVQESGASSSEGSSEVTDPAGTSEGNASSGEAESSQPDGMTSAGSIENMGIDESWKALYAEYLEKNLAPRLDAQEPEWEDGWSFGWIYVNNDSIPELVASSGYEAAGNIICTVVNGKVCELQTSRLGFCYKEFGNVLDNSDGHMGYYYDTIYQITDEGFDLVHDGFYEDIYGDNGPTGERRYSVDGQEVTQGEYWKMVDDAIPAKERVNWAKGSSYDLLMDYLKGNSPKSYAEAYSKLIRDGISASGDLMKGFALIERTDGDPLLLCVGERDFLFCSYDDGMLLVGPAWWFSETEMELVFPGLGIVQNCQFYENNESYLSEYWMKDGSLLASYYSSECEYDENWEPVFDQDGVPVTVYKINGTEYSKDEYYAYVGRNDEKFKQQLAPYNAAYTFIDYLNADDMLKLLQTK